MRLRDLIDLLLLAALWGGSFVLMRVAVPEFGPLAMIWVRVAISTVFLATVLALRGDGSAGPAPWGILRDRAGTLAVVALLNSALPFALFAYAALHVTAGFSALLNATTPLWAAVVAALWLGQRIRSRQVLGLAVAFVGVVVLVWGRIDLRMGASGWAVLAGLAAPVSYGIAANFNRRYLVGIPALAQATGSQIGAAAWLLPTMVVAWPATLPSTAAWASVILLGVAGTGVAYVLYFRLITNIGAVRASAVTFLIPVFAMVIGFAVLGEAVTASMLTGGAIVLLGTALTLDAGAPGAAQSANPSPGSSAAATARRPGPPPG